MKILPSLILTAITAVVFAPFSAEAALSLLTVATVLALFVGDYRRPATPLTNAALKKAQRLPLAA